MGKLNLFRKIGNLSVQYLSGGQVSKPKVPFSEGVIWTTTAESPSPLSLLSNDYSLDYFDEEGTTKAISSIKDSIMSFIVKAPLSIKKIGNGLYLVNSDEGIYFEEVNSILTKKNYAKSRLLQLFIQQSGSESYNIALRNIQTLSVVASSNPIPAITNNLSVFLPPPVTTTLLVNIKNSFPSFDDEGIVEIDNNDTFTIDYPNEDIFYRIVSGDNVTLVPLGVISDDKRLIGEEYPDYEQDVLLPIPLARVSGYKQTNNLSNKLYFNSDYFTYPLVASDNNKSLLSYYQFNYQDGQYQIFSLFQQDYAIINDEIYSIGYQSGILTDFTYVCPVFGLKLMTVDTNGAYFWNQFNRTIQMFTGNRSLSNLMTVSNKGDFIDACWSQSQGIILALFTDSLLSIGETISQLPLDKIDLTDQIIQNKHEAVIKKYELDEEGLFTSIRHYIRPNVTMSPFLLETEFHGSDDANYLNFDRVSLRFIKNSEHPKIKVSSSVNNDGTIEEDVHDFTIDKWDKYDHWPITFAPKVSKGNALSVKIESDDQITLTDFTVDITPWSKTPTVTTTDESRRW
jgi:hypothetical protein